MFKKLSPVVVMVLIAVLVMAAVLMLRMRKNEGFESSENEVMNDAIKDFLTESNNVSSDVVSKKDIEKAARAAALQYCPVPPDYNPSLYIKKTEIEKETACPKIPNMKDYVLKSSIPPPKDCPPCICPKVNVSAGLCKNGKEGEELVCPPPKPCGADECRKVVKCPSPQSISSILDDNMVNNYVNELISDKDYKKINNLKNLLDNIETPSDVVEDLQEENETLRKKLREMEMKVGMSRLGASANNRVSGMMTNKRSNTNSPVVEYNQKCQNNRVNNWYDISGIIGSAFNSKNDPSNTPSNVPSNNKMNSVNSNVDAMMNKSNCMAANTVLEQFY